MRLAPNGFASRSAASSSGAALVAGISNGTKAAVGALFIVLIPAAANQRLLQHRETARNIVWIGMLFCDEITLRRDFCVNKNFSDEVSADTFRRKYNTIEKKHERRLERVRCTKIIYSNNLRIPVIKPRFILSTLFRRSCIRPSRFLQATVACPPIPYSLDFS
jgi:hypothetical protein